MAKTSVGLFETQVAADEVAREIKAAGISPAEIRLLSEPLDMPVSDALSIPGIDFAVALSRELVAIGATETEAQAYVKAAAAVVFLSSQRGRPGRSMAQLRL